MTSSETQDSNLPERFSYRADLRAYDSHLPFVARIISRAQIPNPEHLIEAIDCIEKRRNDPKLYLAVIGEVSSGKSTFINALLRHDLLKRDTLGATATATKLLQGNALEVEVQFKNPQQHPVKVNHKNKVKVNLETGEIAIVVDWLPWIRGIDIKQFIHEVTSSDTLASKIAGVAIAHPSSFLNTDVVIIDTPGTNAENPERRDITCQVVENSADAVIITVPANQPLSTTLIEFLYNVLHPFLHRCVFLVTKMDLIQPSQQSEVIEKIKVSLQKELGIIQPTLFACASQVVIDALNKKEIPSHLEEWDAKFLDLEAALKRRLHQERMLIMTEGGLRQLTKLFSRLDLDLQLQWQQYKIRYETRSRIIIPELPDFAAQQTAICRQILEEAIANAHFKLAKCVESHRENTISRIRELIWNAPDMDALDNIVETEANEIVNEEQQFLQTALQNNIENLSLVAINAGRYFDYKFSEAYRSLPFLGGVTQIKTTGGGDGEVSLNASQAVSSVMSFYQGIIDRDFQYTMGGGGAGAVAGATLGTFMLPGIGTAIGSAIGGSIGFILANFFSTVLEERKKELWENMEPGINNYFETGKTQELQVILDYGDSVIIAVEQRIDAYVARYNKVVSAMRDEQTKELLHLAMLKEETEVILQEIEQRRKFMQAQLQQLSEITNG